MRVSSNEFVEPSSISERAPSQHRDGFLIT